MHEEVIEALESTAPNRKDRGRLDDPRVPSEADIRLWRDALARFLGEIDADLTAGEIIAALEEY